MTLNALGRAAETAISTANRLKDGKLVVFKKIGVCLLVSFERSARDP